MAGLLPIVAGSSTALFPVTRRVVFNVDICTYLDASEKRSKRRPPLTELVLPYTMLSSSDVTLLRNFFNSQKGQFDSSWGMVLGLAANGTISSSSTSLAIDVPDFTSGDVGQDIVIVGAGPSAGLLVSKIATYVDPKHVTINNAASTAVSGADTRWGIYLPNLYFTDDVFTVTEEASTRTTFSTSLKVKQAFVSGYASTTPGSFPMLSNGAVSMLPYSASIRRQTMADDSPVGTRFAWNWWDGSGTMPSDALHSWTLGGPSISNADLAIWESYFRQQWGTYGTFTFTDPDTSTAYTKCRFASNVLEIVHQSYNINQTSLSIIETN